MPLVDESLKQAVADMGGNSLATVMDRDPIASSYVHSAYTDWLGTVATSVGNQVANDLAKPKIIGMDLGGLDV